ncbi:DNA-(apurinic or apyrimidinic site) lyase [Thioalkalivibrio sp. K90mix]|uniref:DNA-formamidopyrimidine glycosylase family protein n=1 Tax=Thioalkalivibrio sp. (strain K90mix) TaxID=396595 RepID=UPI0001959D51|nr:DNA-formamidopyrimidine glycosylase family protein [Thioalkalivibrio sp. K90mix]ADC72753.1 DNA-(apurinic or apyrimidinic site) lyase [Thioalkalivibrio sp. K90mix]
MPEGDTIHKLARVLGPALAGAPLESVATRARRGAVLVEHGAMTVRRVSARGKHLLIALEDAAGRAWRLRTHLGMYGTWHQYAPGAAWHKPDHQAWAVLRLADRVLVCFHPRELAWQLLSEGRADPERLDARVGPDLLDATVELDEVVQRIRTNCDPARPILDVLLDQSLAAGIGNIYKSEVLFLQGRYPLTPVGAITDRDLLDIYCDSARLLRRNLKPGPRITRARAETDEYLHVYGRGGQACRTCGTPVERALLGEHLRATYWCPSCQPGNLDRPRDHQ